MRRTPRIVLLLALLFRRGWSVDTGGCETDADCALGEWCDTTAQFCPLGHPFKAAAGLFMPAPQRRQSDGDLSPMTASSRPVSRANTSTTTMNTPLPAPRMLDDHELPRPPIARNEKGLGSTWSDA